MAFQKTVLIFILAAPDVKLNTVVPDDGSQDLYKNDFSVALSDSIAVV